MCILEMFNSVNSQKSSIKMSFLHTVLQIVNQQSYKYGKYQGASKRWALKGVNDFFFGLIFRLAAKLWLSFSSIASWQASSGF